jgi:hypothetical protein
LTVAAMRFGNEDGAPAGITAHTQPQLQPVLLTLSAMVSRHAGLRRLGNSSSHEDPI